MNFSSFIDYNISKGDGDLIIGDKLRITGNGLKEAVLEIIGFDSSGCPFVKYLVVEYISNTPNDRDYHDRVDVGDILPFPWSNPAQFKI